MKKILTANWFVVLAGALAYLGTTVVCFSTARVGALPARGPRNEARVLVAESWTFQNPELEHVFQEFKLEKEALAAREQQLKELETRLAGERLEIRIVTDAVGRMQSEIDQTVLRIKQDEVANLKKLAKTHAAMSAEGSANILKEQTDEEALKVLFYLKPAESGPILEALAKLGKVEAQRTAALTERLRRTIDAPPEKGKP